MLILRQYLPIISRSGYQKSGAVLDTCTAVVVALTFFGYQTVGVVPHLASKAKRENVWLKRLFGMVLGAVNGYLIVRHHFVLLHQRCAISLSQDVISAAYRTI